MRVINKADKYSALWLRTGWSAGLPTIFRL